MLYAVMHNGDAIRHIHKDIEGIRVRIALIFEDESDADKVVIKYHPGDYVQRFHAVRDLPLPEEFNTIFS